jgi:hypothetical protein
MTQRDEGWPRRLAGPRTRPANPAREPAREPGPQSREPRPPHPAHPCCPAPAREPPRWSIGVVRATSRVHRGGQGPGFSPWRRLEAGRTLPATALGGRWWWLAGRLPRGCRRDILMPPESGARSPGVPLAAPVPLAALVPAASAPVRSWRPGRDLNGGSGLGGGLRVRECTGYATEPGSATIFAQGAAPRAQRVSSRHAGTTDPARLPGTAWGGGWPPGAEVGRTGRRLVDGHWVRRGPLRPFLNDPIDDAPWCILITP